MDLQNIKGEFTIPVLLLQKKLDRIKAFIFDWDGVFNDGRKGSTDGSNFSEIDSMGTNLLRFHYFLQNNAMPIISIMSGEHNKPSFVLAERERFHTIYYKTGNKQVAFDHFLSEHKLSASEVCFIFDDVLDLSIARHCGIRIMVSRACNPLLLQFAKDQNWVDYITQNSGHNHAVREFTEMWMNLNGEFEKTFNHRLNYSEKYKAYLTERNKITTQYFTYDKTAIIPKKP